MKSPALRWSKSLWSYNPNPTGCVLYLPLWHPDLRGSPIKSVGLIGHTGTVTGTTLGENGRTFDNTDDNISIPNQINLNPSGDQTIVLWLYLTTVAGTDRSLWSNQIPGSSTGVWLFVSSDKKIYFYSGTGGAWPGGPNTTTELDATTWYHIVATRISGDMKIYLNGSVDGSPVARAIAGSSSTNYIGRFSESASRWLNGTVRELKIYDRGFTAEEARYDYRMTRGKL